MTIERTYSGWGIGEKVTSAQLNSLDANVAAALDRRAGYGDILMSVVIATGTGRIISSVATGPDANSTFHPNGGNQIVRIPTLSAARAYTLGHTGATGGDRMLFYVEGTGPSPSGYVDILNNVGTGLCRLGAINHASPNMTCEDGAAEVIYNGTSWQLLRGAGAGMRSLAFTSTTTWICPPGIFEIVLYGWGGGGGGGGGVAGGAQAGFDAPGGGAGGAALASFIRVAVSPGVSYDVVIGAGGVGGGPAAGGTNGGNTIFRVTSSAEVLATFQGGAAGHYGTTSTATGMWQFAKGGANVAAPVTGLLTAAMTATASGTSLWAGGFGPGWGGNGTSKSVPSNMSMHYGMNSIQGFNGGTGGIPGANGLNAISVVIFGGGPGGGGGAGPAGAGAPGGLGGAAGTAAGPTAGTAGTTPAAAAANTGAGGGGGGGGGTADAASGVGGAGGSGSNGGSGKLTIMFVK